MQAVTIVPDKLRALAAAQGIDTVTGLAELANVSPWVLYRALNSGRIQPSHALDVASALGAAVSEFSDPGPCNSN